MIDLRFLGFAEARQPEYKEKKGIGYMLYGDRNDYPNYLVELFNKSAKHNAIIKSKVHYITGNGWTGSNEAQTFIAKVNRMESLDELTRKVSLDVELFGGYYLELIWSATGQLSEIWHCDYTKIRTNKDNTQFWYKDDWKDNKEDFIVYPAFNPSFTTGKQILYVKEYRPDMGIYSLPGYFGALNYIESDIEISKTVLGNAQTGFSASKLITLPNGEPSDDEKRNIEKRFTNRFSGSDGKKFILAFVNDSARKPIVEDLGASDITKEDFAKVDSLIQTNIFSGHQITTPSIFGIAEAGKLGARSEMRDGYEIFKNTYVNSKQMHLEGVFNMLANFRGIEDPALKITPTEPIGIEFTEAILKEIAPKEWLLEKAGIDITKYPPAVAGTPTEQLSVNEHIKSLKGREWQNMQRIIREFTKGKINREQATAMLKTGYALSDEEITTWLGSEELEFADQDFTLFLEFGEDKNKFNIWKTKQRFSDEEDLQTFADVSQLESNILDQISKQKDVTPEVLAKVLKTDVKTINNVLADLEERGILKSKSTSIGKGIDKNVIIERELTKPLAKIVEDVKPTTTEILIRYSYAWIAGYSNADIDTSRPFCKTLLDANRFYSRSDIEQMSARLGYSVWDRRGGWWTKPSGKHSESCRHQWQTNVVTRKK
jgi:ribosomal protein S25